MIRTEQKTDVSARETSWANVLGALELQIGPDLFERVRRQVPIAFQLNVAAEERSKACQSAIRAGVLTVAEMNKMADGMEELNRAIDATADALQAKLSRQRRKLLKR